MRQPVLRSGVPLIVLVVAVFVSTALGAIVACHVPMGDRLVTAVAAADAEWRAGECPSCLLEDRAGAVRVNTDAAVDSDAAPLESRLCTSHRPCQHGPQGAHNGGDVVVRGLGVPRDGGPCLTACLAPRLDTSRGQDVSVSDPVPPLAVRAPVAVLGVDRN